MYPELQPIEELNYGECPIEWFSHDQLSWGIPKQCKYKVYHDGSHFVGTPVYSSSPRIALLSKTGAGLQAREKRKVHVRSDVDNFFYSELDKALEENKKGAVLQNHLVRQVAQEFPSLDGVGDYVRGMIKRRWHNSYNRRKRFERKAYLNTWNYFVTLTHDDKKHSELSFAKKVLKTLSNFHTRRGWLYMGVLERAPETNRLHFHGLIYVPNGEMVGNLVAREDYSTAQHCMQKTTGNTFFEKKYGRCDFSKINEAEIMKGNTIDYLLKYIGKGEGRLIYSRGIKDSILLDLSEQDIACEMKDYVQKYVLFDDVVDWARDVMHYCYVQQSFI